MHRQPQKDDEEEESDLASNRRCTDKWKELSMYSRTEFKQCKGKRYDRKYPVQHGLVVCVMVFQMFYLGSSCEVKVVDQPIEGISGSRLGNFTLTFTEFGKCNYSEASIFIALLKNGFPAESLGGSQRATIINSTILFSDLVVYSNAGLNFTLVFSFQLEAESLFVQTSHFSLKPAKLTVTLQPNSHIVGEYFVSRLESFDAQGNILMHDVSSTVSVEVLDRSGVGARLGCEPYSPCLDSTSKNGTFLFSNLAIGLAEARSVPFTVFPFACKELDCNPGQFFATVDILSNSKGMCILCTPGHGCSNGLQEMNPCPKGTYAAASYASTLELMLQAIRLLVPGTFSSPGSTYCISCPPNQWSSIGASSCFDCMDGMFANRTHCIPCLSGHFCINGSSPQKCPDGTFATSSMSVCTSCPNGLIVDCDLSSCRLCATGEDPTNSCQQCFDGHYSDNGRPPCNPCPAGFECPSPTSRIQCSAGYVSPSKSMSCLPCPSGFSCPFGDQPDAIIPCSPGFFSNGAQNACTRCPAGFFCNNASKPPVPCPNGTYSAESSTFCTTCPQGHYCNDSSHDPIPCSPGSFNNLSGSISLDSCVICPRGKIAPNQGASFCIPCPAGYSCASPRSLDALCEPGFFSFDNQMECTICPGGYRCPTIWDSPIPCENGRYSDEGKTICKDCPSGKYCPNEPPGNSRPISCPFGHYSGPGQSICTRCEAGAFCMRCPPGFQCEFDQLPAACPSGKYASGGLQMCFDCPLGYFSASKSGFCTPCPQGTFCPSKNSPPIPCNTGTYSLGMATVCDRCLSGQWSPPASSVCLPCPSGFVCRELQDPVPCTAGFVPGSNQTSCFYCPKDCPSSAFEPISCPAGTFSDFGAENCTSCKQGSYSIGNATTCLLCPPGFYCNMGYHDPEPCQRGTYCDSSCSVCKSCPLGTFSSMLRSSSCLQCPPGHYCDAMHSEIPGVCTRGTFSIQSSTTCTACGPGDCMHCRNILIIKFQLVQQVFKWNVLGKYSNDLRAMYPRKKMRRWTSHGLPLWNVFEKLTIVVSLVLVDIDVKRVAYSLYDVHIPSLPVGTIVVNVHMANFAMAQAHVHSHVNLARLPKQDHPFA
eukprot:768646-Hanusia_phi.AAC.18